MKNAFCSSIQDPDTPENPRNQVMHLTKSLVNKPGDVSRLNHASRFLTRFLRRIETRIIAIPVAQANPTGEVARSITSLDRALGSRDGNRRIRLPEAGGFP